MSYPGNSNNNSGWNFDGIPDNVQSIASTNESFAPSRPGGRSRRGNVASSPAAGDSLSDISFNIPPAHHGEFRRSGPDSSLPNVGSNLGHRERNPVLASLSSALARLNTTSNAATGLRSGVPSRTSSRATSVSSFREGNAGHRAASQVSDDDDYTVLDDGGRVVGHAPMQPWMSHDAGVGPHGQVTYYSYDDDSNDSDTTVLDDPSRIYPNQPLTLPGEQVHAASAAARGLRGGNDDSINRASTPADDNTPRNAVGNVDDSGGNEAQSVAFWPDLRPLLTSENAIRDLRLECPICTDASDDLRVLSCGHILCKECIHRILRNRDGTRRNPRGRTRECPYCRIQLGKKRGCHPDCPQEKSWTVGLPVPGSMAELAKFPLTMTEGGGKPLCCTDCREGRVKHALRELCRELLNDRHARVALSGGSQAASEAPETHTAVPELQDMCDAVMNMLYDSELCAKYAGVHAPSTRQQATAERSKRR